MGYSAESFLAYGVRLGGEEGGWHIRNIDMWEWRPDWLKPNEDGDYAEAEYSDSAMSVLLAAEGFHETDRNAKGYYERRKEALRRVGVDFVKHGHFEYGSELILSAFSFSGYGSRPGEVDADILANAPTTLWNHQIENALNLLAIEPMQPEPGWLLTSWYG